MLQITKRLYGSLTKSKSHRRSEGQNPYDLETIATNDRSEVGVFVITGCFNYPFVLLVCLPLSYPISVIVDCHWFKNIPTVRACNSLTEEVSFSLFLHNLSFGQIGLVRVTESISQVGGRFHGSLGKGLLPLQAAVVGTVVEARGGTLVWQTQIQISLTSRS